jgi:DNA-binding winged helix-turn-helix (wHTH) protein
MIPATRESYLFGAFRLSGDGTLLVRNGEVIALAPKVLRTLLALVQRAGEVVRKQDLLREVWPDSFVEETGLTRNISLLRQALGDDGQRLIVTVARIGYRFAGPVQRSSDGREPAGSEPARAAAGQPRGDRQRPIVGREGELGLLRAALERAAGGRGAIVAVTGEPGIGKTTLLETFLRGVEETCVVGGGGCSERLSGTEPHLPLLEALEALTTARPALVSPLRRAAPTWSQHVAPAGDRAVTQSPGSGSPERLMRELTTFLEEASRAHPILISIEDLHWADVSTTDVLAHLAPRIARMRLLLLVTYRQREMLLMQHPFTRLRGELIARGLLAEVPVSLLGLGDVREYLRLTFDDLRAATDLAPVVFQRTEGNPLFVVEIVRYLRQHGVPGQPVSLARDVPESLRGLIDRMLGGLDSETRQLLSVASVQGTEFDSATVARVSGAVPFDVEDRLRTADHVQALVRFEREHELADGSVSLVYRFAHVLYQDALVGSIAPSRRIEWARQVADTLIALEAGRTDVIAGSLAMLFETGREYWKASEFFLITSRHASRLFAFAAACELAARGLRCLESVHTIDRRELQHRELELAFARLIPLASVQGYASPGVEDLTRHVVELAGQLGDVSAAGSALVATWLVRMVRGECLAAKNAGQRLAALAAEARDDILLINGHMNSQIAAHHLGDFSAAREYATKVMALAGRVPHPDRCIGALDPVVASLAESSRNSWMTGYLARATADSEKAVAIGEELRHPDSLAFARVFHAWVQGYRSDWTSCVASAEAGIKIASDSGSVQTLAWNRCVRGWALAHAGDVEAGRAELAAAIDASRAIMGQVALPQFSAMMAEVLLLRDDVAGAEAWLTGAKDFQRSHEDRNCTAEVHRLSAVCYAHRGRIAAARSELHDATVMARSQGAATFELRAALTLSALDIQEGRAAVRRALAAFPEPESWPEIAKAHEILQRGRAS